MIHITIACQLRLFPKKNQYASYVNKNCHQVWQELLREDWSFIENTDAPESWSKVKEIPVLSCDKHTTTTWIHKPRTLPFLTGDIKLAIQKRKGSGKNIKIY